jgi:hypothetical protein
VAARLVPLRTAMEDRASLVVCRRAFASVAAANRQDLSERPHFIDSTSKVRRARLNSSRKAALMLCSARELEARATTAV